MSICACAGQAVPAASEIRPAEGQAGPSSSAAASPQATSSATAKAADKVKPKRVVDGNGKTKFTCCGFGGKGKAGKQQQT